MTSCELGMPTDSLGKRRTMIARAKVALCRFDCVSCCGYSNCLVDQRAKKGWVTASGSLLASHSTQRTIWCARRNRSLHHESSLPFDATMPTISYRAIARESAASTLEHLADQFR